ncbi:hypothetical protein Enr13x_72460 [Stieleria neptunia]|uniref:Uncharacterized protein n=1 Tax=Stieleria neptunia TaxID=2527979 RepID=A0A518I2T5_9BACT|nr:hypothetical protein Enr13x_72460 [Stieleria neptunia]
MQPLWNVTLPSLRSTLPGGIGSFTARFGNQFDSLPLGETAFAQQANAREGRRAIVLAPCATIKSDIYTIDVPTERDENPFLSPTTHYRETSC